MCFPVVCPVSWMNMLQCSVGPWVNATRQMHSSSISCLHILGLAKYNGKLFLQLAHYQHCTMSLYDIREAVSWGGPWELEVDRESVRWTVWRGYHVLMLIWLRSCSVLPAAPVIAPGRRFGATQYMLVWFHYRWTLYWMPFWLLCERTYV